MNTTCLLFFTILLISCSFENKDENSENERVKIDFKINEDRPYHEFEMELTIELCKCINLDKTATANNFLEEYGLCVEKTSQLLQKGIDKYPEDSIISKQDYLSKIDTVIMEIFKSGRCGKILNKKISS